MSPPICYSLPDWLCRHQPVYHGASTEHFDRWDIFTSAMLVAAVSYLCGFGGQTPVIMTDLFQGVMLLITGLLLLIFGIEYLGGFDMFTASSENTQTSLRISTKTLLILL